jgi:hypothetical protein
MSDELDAAGAMATAGFTAGAIEGREQAKVHEGACLNCEAPLAGRYCAQCGQAAHAHRTLAHVFEEFLHGVLHFDTKVWRTLPMLLFRPGTLTRNYIYGKRARYISPLAMFLLAVFFMFFVFSFVDMPIRADFGPTTPEAAAEEVAEARAVLAEAERELAAAAAAPENPNTGDLEENLAHQAVELASAEVARREEDLARLQAESARAQGDSAPPGSTPAPDSQTWQEQLSAEARAGELNVYSGWPTLDARITHALENPDLALYKIQQAAYKYSFLLVPISLPFMWLLFVWRRGLTLYDHVVFILYGLSFASLMFVALAALAATEHLAWLGGTLVGLGMPAHMYFQLKGAYALGWWSAIWRTSFLILFALVALALFLAAILVLGLAG